MYITIFKQCSKYVDNMLKSEKYAKKNKGKRKKIA